MTKWRIEHDTDDAEYPIVWIGNTYFVAEHDPNWIVDAHNADIAALTAERDELQRRMDAVVNWAMSYVEDDCYCTHDNEPVCEVCENTAAIIAIAEGREG